MVDKDVLASNPIERVQGPKATPWRPKPLSEEDLGRVMRAAASPSPTARRPWPELEMALCAVLVTTGVRVSESWLCGSATSTDPRRTSPGFT